MMYPARRLVIRRPHLDALRRFAGDQTGAVTVDFVVLSAAVIGLAIGAVAAIRNGSLGVSDTIESSLLTANIDVIDFSGN